jgi:predicted nucleic acid-binding Zn ribbon protein
MSPSRRDPRWNEDEDDLDDEDWPEDNDEGETVRCPECGTDVYEDSQHCPGCGHLMERSRPFFSNNTPWWMILGAILAFGACAVLVF